MVEYQNALNEFVEELDALTNKYTGSLPSYEMIFRLTTHAVFMSLSCAPDNLVGMTTIMASVQNGIAEYKALHPQEVKKVKKVNKEKK